MAGRPQHKRRDNAKLQRCRKCGRLVGRQCRCSLTGWRRTRVDQLVKAKVARRGEWVFLERGGDCVKSYCYITKKHGGMYIDCSYDPDFLEVLKSSVPASSRNYSPETKQWWVSDKYARQAERDCNTFFENVIEC